jgi:hypothetical protein
MVMVMTNEPLEQDEGVTGLHVARFVKYIEEEARELAGSFG